MQLIWIWISLLIWIWIRNQILSRSGKISQAYSFGKNPTIRNIFIILECRGNSEKATELYEVCIKAATQEDLAGDLSIKGGYIHSKSIPIHSNWGSQRIDFIASLVNYLHQLPLLFAMAIPNSIIPLTSVADLDLSDPPHLPGSGSNTNNLHVTGSTPKRITTNHRSWLRIRTVCLDPDCNPL